MQNIKRCHDRSYTHIPKLTLQQMQVKKSEAIVQTLLSNLTCRSWMPISRKRGERSAPLPHQNTDIFFTLVSIESVFFSWGHLLTVCFMFL